MTIFKNLNDNKSYIIEHLIYDIHHLNHGAFCGIYAYPYKWKGNTIHLQSKDIEECQQFVTDNFEPISSYK